MHAPTWTLKCWKILGHVMLGLSIHFLYFSQPSVSKTCSFINLCIHPSLFWVFEKLSQHLPFRCTHIFSKTGYDQWNFFSKKSWKLPLFTSILFFSQTTFYFLLFSFFLPSFSFLTCSIFLFLFFSFLSYLPFVHFLSFFFFFSFSFSIWKGRADEGAHYLLTSNHKVNEKCTKW